MDHLLHHGRVALEPNRAVAIGSVHTVASGRLLQELTYGYDLVGNVKTLTNALGEATGRRSGAISYAFDYDDLYRLTTATGTAKARPGVIDQFKATYQFDEIHNLTQLDQTHWLTTANDLGTETAFPPHTNHHFAYAYGTAGPHQATKIGDTNIVYDANGNTLRECRDHGDSTCTTNGDHLRSFYWGEDDELLAVIDGGGWNITRFIYDAGGNRIVKLGRGGESITIGQFFALKGRKAATKHVFVGETRLASKLLPPPGWEPDWSDGTSVSGPIVQTAALVASPTNGSGCDPSAYQPQKCPINPSPDPVIDRRLTDTKVRPETYYYHSDHLGSTSWVTDQNGRVHEHVDYFPYGEVWRDPRGDSDGAPVKGQQFLFTSKEMDEETGLYYFGARYHDPVRARWMSPDPLGLDLTMERNLPGHLSVYAFVRWSPIGRRDPNGLFDVFGVVEGDLSGIFGVEAAIGIVIDTDHLLESGIFVSGGWAVGPNVGIGAGGGFALRDIEGPSVNLDINAGAASITFSGDDQGFNGITVTKGPGIGVSVSVTNTKPLSPQAVIDFVKDVFGIEKPKKEPTPAQPGSPPDRGSAQPAWRPAPPGKGSNPAPSPAPSGSPEGTRGQDRSPRTMPSHNPPPRPLPPDAPTIGPRTR